MCVYSMQVCFVCRVCLYVHERAARLLWSVNALQCLQCFCLLLLYLTPTRVLPLLPSAPSCTALTHNHSCMISYTHQPQHQHQQVSGTPIPVPRVDKADKAKFDATVDEIHAKVSVGSRWTGGSQFYLVEKLGVCVGVCVGRGWGGVGGMRS